MTLDRLRDDGWAVLDGLFTAGECDQIVASDRRRTPPAITRDLAAFATDARWAGPATGLLGPDVRFFREQPLRKQPRSAATLPWHQDHGFAPMHPATFVTFLLALEDVTEANGCLWVQPGSHRLGPVAHVPAGAILRADLDPVDVDGTPVRLAKGSALALSSLTLHRSGANRTDGERRMWLLQFCDAAAVDARTGEPHPGCPVVAEGGVWRSIGGRL